MISFITVITIYLFSNIIVTELAYKNMPANKALPRNLSYEKLLRYLEVDEISGLKDIFVLIILAIILSKIIDITIDMKETTRIIYKTGFILGTSSTIIQSIKTHRVGIKLLKLKNDTKKQEKFMSKLGFDSSK